MKSAVLGGLALIAFIEPAAAAHCGHHRIYRVHMGVCVSAHSRLARELAPTVRRLERPKEPLVYVRVTIPAGKPEEPPQAAPEPDVDIPYTLPGSRMFDRIRPSPWVRP